ncbi:MAG: hypothetical protein WB795_23455, partial [Candidatus Acidiferrales bacterium]
YIPWTCNADGQLYERPGGRGLSVMRVARDGSTVLFTLPETENAVDLVAPASSGLAMLNWSYSRREGVSYRMYRFDSQAKLLTQHTLHAMPPDFQPGNMAVTSSGKTIVVGYSPRLGTDDEHRIYRGAVLDGDDKVEKLFEFPATADGKKWRSAGHRMQGEDGVALEILESGTEPTFAIATIAESGQISITPLATTSSPGGHEWLFGNGAAAELHEPAGQKYPQIDAFDLTSGQKASTKTVRPAGATWACYLGDELGWLSYTAPGRVRGLSQDTAWLVTVKLE